MSAHAIGELIIAGQRRGTAFAVTEDLLLTCWHCVADPSDLSRSAQRDVVVRFADGVTVSARFLQDNQELDLALLGILPETPLPPAWTPLPLGRDSDGARGTPADVTGWPIDNPSRSTPQVLPGRVDQETVTIGAGSPALQVFSDQVAARLRPRGFSGAPVIVRTPAGPVVIGVVRWMQEDEADSGVAVGGTIYASRASDIAACWQALRPAPAAAADLAGGAGAPLRSEVEDFVSGRLTGPGGDLPFAGRSAELSALTRWFEDGTAPYHLVAGLAGIGKSTLLVRWCVDAMRRRKVRVVLVPISVRYETNSVAQILSALNSRLARVHGEVYDSSAFLADPRGTARTLLERSAPAETSVVVVLDGLDEARDQSSWLRLFPRTLGKGVRILVSARHVLDHPTGQAWADHLGLAGAEITTLMPLGPPAMADLLGSVRPGEPADELAVAADRLWELTGGEPVTTSLYLESIRSRPELTLAAWRAAQGNTAPGLEGFFGFWWREQQALWEGQFSAHDAERVLRILVTAEGPLSRNDLRRLVNRLPEPLDAVRLDHAVGILGRFVLPGHVSDSLVVAHPAITEMMRALLHRTGADDELQEVFVAWGSEVLSGLRSGALTTADVPDYLSRHVAEHLTAGSTVRPAAFDLAMPFWRRHKDATSDTTEAFQTDVRLVMEQARRMDQARFDRGEAPRLLPERIMCAAEIAGEEGTIKQGVTPPLAAEFVRYRLWRIGRAFDFVERNTHAGMSSRVEGVVALAPVVAADQLSWLEKLLDSALESVYPEEKAAAVAAWAVRLFELGHVSESLAAALRLPEGHEQRPFVAVWVLADLIPLLPDEAASAALTTVFAELFGRREVYDSNICYAVAKFTTQVSLEHAERLWHLTDVAALPAKLRSSVQEAERSGDPNVTRALMIAAMKHATEEGNEWSGWVWMGWPAFVAVARWVPERQRGTIIRDVLEVREGEEPDRWASRCREALVPSLLYDGLLSAVPGWIAADAVEWVRELVEGGDRLACLAQLLPVLDDELRRLVADEIFSAFLDDFVQLNGSLNAVLPAVPAFVAGGETDRLLDVVSRGRKIYWLGRELSRTVTADQARAALADLPAEDEDRRRLRNAFLARLASFGHREAAEVLAQLSAAGSDDALPGEVRWLLREYLGTDPQAQPASEQVVDAWWRHASRFASGDAPYSYPPRPRNLDEDELRYALLRIDANPRAVLRLAVDLTAHIEERHVPMLIERARAMPHGWPGLTLLAAGTHLPPGSAADVVADEIRSVLDALRSAADSTGGRHWFAADSAWYARSPNPWAPFFARLVAPRMRAEVASQLFDGGYLDGVLMPPIDANDSLDTWARDALAITPLLNAAQLHDFAAMASRNHQPRGIFSGTLRAIFEAGLAVGYATCGELERAYYHVRRIGGPNPDDLRHDVLVEIMYLLDPADLIGWIAQVHAIVRSARGRGPLWPHLQCRLGELSDAQLWAVLDQWLTMPHRGGRAEVLADALLYRYAIARITGGTEECVRLQTLIEERETG